MIDLDINGGRAGPQRCFVDDARVKRTVVRESAFTRRTSQTSVSISAARRWCIDTQYVCRRGGQDHAWFSVSLAQVLSGVSRWTAGGSLAVPFASGPQITPCHRNSCLHRDHFWIMGGNSAAGDGSLAFVKEVGPVYELLGARVASISPREVPAGHT